MVTGATLPLGPGDEGDAVRDLQRRLARVGDGAALAGETGQFAAATEQELKRFQEGRGLRPDGRCGPQTWSALVEAGFSLGDRLLYQTAPMTRGDDVGELQARLGRLGFLASRVDGIFGPRTAAALVDFQRNAGLTTDGICGPETVAALDRLRNRPLHPVKGGVVEREELRTAPPRLAGRRIVVGDTGGLAALAAATERALAAVGAVAAVCAHPDQSAQAAEANRFGAEVYLGLALGVEPGCTCAYYATPDYESVGGRRLAELVATEVAAGLDLAGRATGMRLPVLRETRMPAVLCELGPPSRVVEGTPDLVINLRGAVTAWAEGPIDV